MTSQVGDLEGVYHFALLRNSSEESPAEQKRGKVKSRRGTNIVGEMLDKTTQLNAKQQARSELL